MGILTPYYRKEMIIIAKLIFKKDMNELYLPANTRVYVLDNTIDSKGFAYLGIPRYSEAFNNFVSIFNSPPMYNVFAFTLSMNYNQNIFYNFMRIIMDICRGLDVCLIYGNLTDLDVEMFMEYLRDQYGFESSFYDLINPMKDVGFNYYKSGKLKADLYQFELIDTSLSGGNSDYYNRVLPI